MNKYAENISYFSIKLLSELFGDNRLEGQLNSALFPFSSGLPAASPQLHVPQALFPGQIPCHLAFGFPHPARSVVFGHETDPEIMEKIGDFGRGLRAVEVEGSVVWPIGG